MSDAPKPTPPLAGTVGHTSDLTTRFAMGIFLIAVALAAIWFGGWPFRLLVLVGAAVMLAEWAEMHRVAWLWTWAGVALLAALLLGGMEYFFPTDLVDTVQTELGEDAIAVDVQTFLPLLYLLAAVIGCGLMLALAARRPTLGWGFVYVAVPALCLLTMSWLYTAIVFWVMVVTWATDIGAFFAGKGIGGPRLAPSISPAKTWAGLGGGIVAAGGLGYLAASYFGMGEADDDVFALFFYLGAPMAIVAQAGDLYESWVKRRCGVKDSGTILPGHGGVLDRCDGLIAVVFVTMLVLAVGLWFG